MRIVFLGTAIFGLPCLQALHQHPDYQVVGVVTMPDKRGGRGRKEIISSSIKTYALNHHIPVLQPEKLRNPEFLQTLSALQADIQIVVAFRMLPEIVWAMPPHGTLNLHASLLPQYRGAAPINWAIINGEQNTGLTTFLLKHQIDTGDLLLQSPSPIYPNETFGQLYHRLSEQAPNLLIQTLDSLKNNQIQAQSQNEALVSHAPKLFHENCRLDCSKSPLELYNHIRGLCPDSNNPAIYAELSNSPNAWTELPDGEKIKIFQSQLSNLIPPPHTPQGQLFKHKKRLYLSCGQNNCLEILSLQPDKRKRLTAKDFLNAWNGPNYDNLSSQ